MPKLFLIYRLVRLIGLFGLLRVLVADGPIVFLLISGIFGSEWVANAGYFYSREIVLSPK
jgi:hypothetical protein